MTTVDATIREVLDRYGRLAAPAGGVADGDDLYQLGLTSHTTVKVMLALEDAFEVEFPDQFFRKSTFSSVAAIREALLELTTDRTG